jgi:hypothetical protein
MGLNRTVAAIFGVVYLIVGAYGFIGAGDDNMLIGLFEVNALHNIVHVVIGLVLLWGAMSTPMAVMMNRVVGIVLIALGILGIFVENPLDLIPIGGNDVWLHLASGVILLGAGLMSGRETAAA